MRFSQEFRDPEMTREIARKIADRADAQAVIMEVCGTHTMSAARFGLRSLLPNGVSLISGPGCPVCVTTQHDIDSFIALGRNPERTLVSFGDMLRVPGSSGSLEKLRAEGGRIKVVYSPFDVVDIAEEDTEVIFFGVGFETTMPATALAIISAAERGLSNFSVYCAHKTIPNALRALLSSDDVRVSGLLLPGHVTTIIGAEAYEFIPGEFGIPCAVAGFEPVDMLLGVESILRQLREGVARVDNAYSRAAPINANPQAKAALDRVFQPCDAEWRGLGTIPGSGVGILKEYSLFDAAARYTEELAAVPTPKPSACRCGDVLRGVLAPPDCPLFRNQCSPEDPIGPCMVSSEGACAAAYLYGN